MTRNAPGDVGIDLTDNPETKSKRPRQWNVVILNDDFTPIQFVIALIIKVFHHSRDEAGRITMEIHQYGKAVAGTYTHEIAETKAHETVALAREHEYPLLAIIEPAPEA